MNTSSPLPGSPATYSRSTPVFHTSPDNTRHLCSSAPEGQPKRRAVCDAAVQGALDGGSGVFAGDPRQYHSHQSVMSTSMRRTFFPAPARVSK